MTYSLKQRKISALRYAHKLIKDEQQDYICYALHAYWEKYPKAYDAVEYLKEYIDGALCGHMTLASWVKDATGVEQFVAGTEKIRSTRLAWIEWMLECYGTTV